MVEHLPSICESRVLIFRTTNKAKATESKLYSSFQRSLQLNLFDWSVSRKGKTKLFWEIEKVEYKVDNMRKDQWELYPVLTSLSLLPWVCSIWPKCMCFRHRDNCSIEEILRFMLALPAPAGWFGAIYFNILQLTLPKHILQRENNFVGLLEEINKIWSVKHFVLSYLT